MVYINPDNDPNINAMIWKYVITTAAEGKFMLSADEEYDENEIDEERLDMQSL